MRLYSQLELGSGAFAFVSAAIAFFLSSVAVAFLAAVAAAVSATLVVARVVLEEVE